MNLQQIRTNLEMESHEEKLHLMIRQSKEDTAKEEMKRKAVAIRESQREMAKKGSMQGFGSGGGSLDDLAGGGASKDAPEIVENASSVMTTTASAPKPAPATPGSAASRPSSTTRAPPPSRRRPCRSRRP